MQKIKTKLIRSFEKYKPREIQTTIMITSSLVSIISMLLMGIILYTEFTWFIQKTTLDNTEKMMNQTSEALEDYLGGLRRISDTAYYNVIKECDISDQIEEIQEKLNLIYEANKGDLRSIGLYNRSGSLLLAEPLAIQKEDPDVTRQEWFEKAMGKIENMHFSTPHIQHLFDDGTGRYYWVISLSRAVDLTQQGNSQMGVLLIDMDFDRISGMMSQINTSGKRQYFYLCDREGTIIYHPKLLQIKKNLYQENSQKIAGYKDGVFEDSFQNTRRKVVIDTIGYTGWKLVSVIPNSALTSGISGVRQFIFVIMIFMLMMLVLINRLSSEKISSPIRRLNKSVEEYKAGKEPKIYVGGTLEIQHLGLSVQKSYEQIDLLMKEIVKEQNERRKSELAALQSQINPHFLYNTLDSITWMVEDGRNEDASFMISQLARLLRISLSKGYSLISIKDELQHAKSYMNIQKIRYKSAFSVQFNIDPEIEKYSTAKLILQPILENAIHYGINPLDDCGEIKVSGRIENHVVCLRISDNGVGMTPQQAGQLVSDKDKDIVRLQPSKKGSGIGIRNVHHRIQILFGKEYGLCVESELDEGTTVTLKFPAVLFTSELQEAVEKGQKLTAKEKMEDEK